MSSFRRTKSGKSDSFVTVTAAPKIRMNSVIFRVSNQSVLSLCSRCFLDQHTLTLFMNICLFEIHLLEQVHETTNFPICVHIDTLHGK